MSQRNLYKEIVGILIKNKLDYNDILFVCTDKERCTWNDFVIQSKMIYYTPNIENPKLSTTLKIVANEWRLERYTETSEWNYILRTFKPKSSLVSVSTLTTLTTENYNEKQELDTHNKLFTCPKCGRKPLDVKYDYITCLKCYLRIFNNDED